MSRAIELILQEGHGTLTFDLVKVISKPGLLAAVSQTNLGEDLYWGQILPFLSSILYVGL